MTKPKSSTRSSTRSAGTEREAEQMQRSIMESAQQIWLAGIGAFSRAQDEGTRMFEALVREGSSIEKSTRQFATGSAEAMREALEEQVGQVRGRAGDTWGRFEKLFEQRVQGTLSRLGVPTRQEVQALSAQVEALNAQLAAARVDAAHPAPKKQARSPRKAAPRKAAPAPGTTSATPATVKTAGKKPVAGKSAAAKKRGAALPRVDRPKAPGGNA